LQYKISTGKPRTHSFVQLHQESRTREAHIDEVKTSNVGWIIGFKKEAEEHPKVQK
jgi:hypothetical protein